MTHRPAPGFVVMASGPAPPGDALCPGLPWQDGDHCASGPGPCRNCARKKIFCCAHMSLSALGHISPSKPLGSWPPLPNPPHKGEGAPPPSRHHRAFAMSMVADSMTMLAVGGEAKKERTPSPLWEGWGGGARGRGADVGEGCRKRKTPSPMARGSNGNRWNRPEPVRHHFIVGMTNSAPSLMPERPARGDGLGLGPELDRIGAVLVEVTEGGGLPAAEGMIGQRHRDRHVDADHADIDARGEVAGGVAVTGVDGNAVAIFVAHRQGERILVFLRPHHRQDGPKISVL